MEIIRCRYCGAPYVTREALEIHEKGCPKRPVVSPVAKPSLPTAPPVTLITKDCALNTLHPDLIRYVPRMPPRGERCYVEIGIAGKDVGEPRWGFVATLTYEYYVGLGVGFLGIIHVWEEFRRRGYASRLIEHALEDIRRQGIKRVYTAPVRPASVELAKSLGFRRFGETPLYYKELL